MNNFLSTSASARSLRARLYRGISVLVCACAFSGGLSAQDDVAPKVKSTEAKAEKKALTQDDAAPKVKSTEAKAEKKALRRETNLVAQADPAADGQRRRQRGTDGADTGNNGGRGNFDPAQMQDRMMTMLRTQLDVTDDAEWKLIQDRITAVSEVRRAGGGGIGGLVGGRGGPGGPGGGPGSPGGSRGGRGGNPEADALRQAVQDKLPEAEIKSRLTRLRESRKMNEEKLVKVQEDLRALLSVPQEAVAVMFGLLP